MGCVCVGSVTMLISVQVQSLWEEAGSKPATEHPAHVAFPGHIVAFSIYSSLDFGGSIAVRAN